MTGLWAKAKANRHLTDEEYYDEEREINDDE